MSSGSKELPPKENLAPLLISFGDIVSLYGKKESFVITDVGEEYWCIGAPIILSNGMEEVRSVGTLQRSYIDEVVDHWELPRILQGMSTYFHGLSLIMEQTLQNDSLKPPRELHDNSIGS